MAEFISEQHDQPLVSIIMSTYNGECFLEEQLTSLIAQDYPNMEILVSDDVSTDGTMAILEKWQQAYPAIISVQRNKKNVGWSLNFGRGLERAKGQFIAWCDQDDIWMTDKISTMVDYFVKHPETTLLYHDAKVFTGNMETVAANNNGFHWTDFQGSDPVTLFWHCRILGHRMMFPAKITPFILPAVDISYDWYIQVFAASYGSIHYLDKQLVAQRMHDNNTTGSKTPQVEDGYLKNRLEHLQNFAKFVQYMKPSDMAILKGLVERMERHTHGKFDWSLFLFAIKNRYKLYGFLAGGNIFTREIFRWRTARAWAKNW